MARHTAARIAQHKQAHTHTHPGRKCYLCISAEPCWASAPIAVHTHSALQRMILANGEITDVAFVCASNRDSVCG
jgi:hypothetical protein